jgi:hypothetical protein
MGGDARFCDHDVDAPPVVTTALASCPVRSHQAVYQPAHRALIQAQGVGQVEQTYLELRLSTSSDSARYSERPRPDARSAREIR